MNNLRIDKVTALPQTLTGNTLYIIKSGNSGFIEIQFTNSLGTLSYPIANVSAIDDIVISKITALLGTPDGIAALDSNGMVPSSQLPSYVDDVLEFATLAAFPVTGETGKIYVAVNTSKTFRWSGTTYITTGSGAVESVAGKTGIVTLVKADVGLDSVDNVSDANKPVSTLQAFAINAAAENAASDATNKADAAQAAAIAASAPVGHVGSGDTAHSDAVAGGASGFMTGADKTKLNNISGSNTGDETLATIKTKLGITTLSGDNTGDQTSVTGNAGTATKLATQRLINDVPFDGTANITINAVDATARIAASEKGTANGVANLDSNGLVPSSQLPSYVDDVLEFANLTAFPVTGESGKIYVAADTSKTFRWATTVYVPTGSGAVESVAGKTGVVTLVKADVGLSNVDNTSDVNKPVSTLQANADTTVATNAASDATSKANAAQAAAIAASAPVGHVGSGSTAHSAVVAGGASGFMTGSDKTKLDNVSGSNTGDETLATIKTKLGITTLSGDNTGDQTSVTGNAGTATKLVTARLINGVSFDGSANITLNAVDSTARVASTEKGAANGVATLDATGKLTTAQIPASLVGALVYQGVWNANTNTPILTSAVGTKGQYYKVSTAGVTSLDGQAYWQIGDLAIYDGVAWERVEGGATEVSSVFGRVGAVVLTNADVVGALANGSITNLMLANSAVTNLSGTNSGDETLATIKTKLGITTLSGSNTGDQTSVTGNAGTATKLATARLINGMSFDGTADITISSVDSTARIASSEKGAINGVATLDGTGKLTTGQIPASLVGALVYQGVWNATTNSPALASAAGTKGYYYKVSTAGATSLDGQAYWQIGDLAIYDGAAWERVEGGSTEVTTVFGRVGAVVLTNADVVGALANGSITNLMLANTAVANLSGTNSGDETLATIKTKLGITTLSGSNTGDQTTITGNAGTATKLATARTINGVSFDGTVNITIVSDDIDSFLLMGA